MRGTIGLNARRVGGVGRLTAFRIDCLPFVIAGLLCLLWSAVGQAQNIIPDPSFENEPSPWVLGDYASSIDDTVARSGQRSLKLISDGAPVNHNVFQNDIGAVIGGLEYEYRVWVRTTGINGPALGDKPLGIVRWPQIPNPHQKERYVWAPQGTTGWRQMRMDLQAPLNATRVDIGFRSWPGVEEGYSHWDDVSLTPKDISHRGALVATYQAEDAGVFFNGTIQSTELGYTGSGYFAPNIGEESYLQWNNVSGGPNGGIRILSFRYSLEGWEKQWLIRVNGVNLGNVQPVQTGWINSWATQDREVTLNPGNNTVRVELPSYDGKILLRVDKLDLYQKAAVLPEASAPTIDPDGGTFSGSVTVSLQSETPGASIHYTTDGSIPDADAPIYTDPFTLDSDATVQAFTAAPGFSPSGVVLADFTVTAVLPEASAPTIDPDGGTFSGSVTVTLASATAGATIHYTLDGSIPDVDSPIYTDPFILDSDATVQAFTVAPGFSNSPVATAVFTVDNPAGNGGSGVSGGGSGCFINTLVRPTRMK